MGIAGGVGVDGEQPEVALAGEVAAEGFGELGGGGEVDVAVGDVDRGAEGLAVGLEPRRVRRPGRPCRSAFAYPCGVMTLRAAARWSPSLRSRQMMKRPAATMSSAPDSMA